MDWCAESSTPKSQAHEGASGDDGNDKPGVELMCRLPAPPGHYSDAQQEGHSAGNQQEHASAHYRYRSVSREAPSIGEDAQQRE